MAVDLANAGAVAPAGGAPSGKNVPARHAGHYSGADRWRLLEGLRKGWMDGRIGYKVLYISALECSQFLEEKKNKNDTWDGLSL